MQQIVNLDILILSTINADHCPERHRVMVFMTMFVIQDDFTAANKTPAPFKRLALLVCTTDESVLCILIVGSYKKSGLLQEVILS